MERNALIAIALCFLILIGYQEVTRRLYPPPEEPIATAPEASPQRPEAAPPAAPKPPDTIAEAAPAAAPIEGRDIVVENDLLRAVFSTAGGRLENVKLKKFRQDVAADSPPLDLLHEVPEGDRPLGLVLRRGGTDVDDSTVLYEADRDSVSVSGTDSGEVTLRGVLGGAQIVKRIRARGDRYLLEVEVEVAPGSAPSPEQIGIAWQDHIGHPARLSNTVMTTSVLAIQDSHLHRFGTQCWFLDRMRGQCHTLDDHAGTNLSEEHIRWAAFDGHYFLNAIIPKTDQPDAAALDLRYKNEVAKLLVLWPKGTLNASFELYLGPKKIEILEDAPQSLRAALDLGIFTFIALPLLHVLRLSHRLTGNYGIDIILLTVVIKALFMPLTQRSMKSMREMQKLQPQMAKIRERFKDKPDELNKEIIELYRRHKVNPLGGCLPMVLQIPVFIGLYQALLNAVELRHAPFFSWITDLSAPDRLGAIHLPFVEPPGVPVLTLLMGVSMFVQQLMTPTGADPAQQRMMLIMPVIFTFMFISFPSGLALYWLVNNILTIAQQYTINRPEQSAAGTRGAAA
jgi:YidC/Oxa1 family membrane protein insertase